MRLGFARIYHSKLTKMQMVLAVGAGLLVCAQPLTTFVHRFWLGQEATTTAHVRE